MTELASILFTKIDVTLKNASICSLFYRCTFTKQIMNFLLKFYAKFIYCHLKIRNIFLAEMFHCQTMLSVYANVLMLQALLTISAEIYLFVVLHF